MTNVASLMGTLNELNLSQRGDFLLSNVEKLVSVKGPLSYIAPECVIVASS